MVAHRVATSRVHPPGRLQPRQDAYILGRLLRPSCHAMRPPTDRWGAGPAPRSPGAGAGSAWAPPVRLRRVLDRFTVPDGTRHLWRVVLRSDATRASWPWGDCRTPVCSTQPWECAAHHLCTTPCLARALAGTSPLIAATRCARQGARGLPPLPAGMKLQPRRPKWILPSPNNVCVSTKMGSSRRGGAMGACRCHR
jgi:hypothetical protein